MFWFWFPVYIHVYSCSVTKSYPSLWDPMDCSTPGFHVLHHLLEFAHTHVHWVGDAIQPSHPLPFPSPPAFSLSRHRFFSSESPLCLRWPNYWSLSFGISPSNEYLELISLVAQTVKRLSTMRETWVRSLGREDPLEKEMAIHTSTVAWKIP